MDVSVCRRDDTYVCLDCFGRADPFELFFLQDPQQFGLKLQRNFADFVQENRAASRSSNRPTFCIAAPVKRLSRDRIIHFRSVRDAVQAQLTFTRGRFLRELDW